MDTAVVERAVKLMHLTFRGGRWNLQRQYGKPFLRQHRPLRMADIRRHLAGEVWIATLCRDDGVTDRIIFDIDCRSDAGRPARDQRYAALRTLVGPQRVPLVWGTPSGAGIRLAYRIPETLIEQISRPDGVLRLALKSAGLAPRKGGLEVFPSASQCDRQMFGRGMPYLDPQSLLPLSWDSRDCRDADRLAAAVAHVEEWYARPEIGLLEDLTAHARRVSVEAHVAAPTSHGTSAPAAPAAASSRVVASPRTAFPDERRGPSKSESRLVDAGLDRPRSRYHSEFIVGRTMWLWPELFKEYGLPAVPGREDVAHALARWLAARNNGLSDEWSRDASRMGPDAAQDHWARRYLKASPGAGNAAVDNMLAAAQRLRRLTTHLSPSEFDGILSMARRARNCGFIKTAADLYRLEVWLCSLRRWTKKQVYRGGVPGDEHFVEITLPVVAMAGWPWGSRYQDYLRVLAAQKNLVLVRPHLWIPGGNGRARTYRTPRPDHYYADQLLMLKGAWAGSLAKLNVAGRRVTATEIHHALHLYRRQIDCAKRYGRRTSERIRKIVDAAVGPLF
jgi:hypothetical protein